MKILKQVRVVLSILMGVECGALALLWAGAPVHARLAGQMQISSSLAGTSLGGCLVCCTLWLLVTFLLGRVYCAAFCPVGVGLDVVGFLRTHLGRSKRVCRRRAANPLRWWVLGAYALCVLLGVGLVPLLVEPWPAFVNVVQQASRHVPAMAASVGVGAVWGMICAAASVLLLSLYALLAGRSFCNDICPVGSMLALAAPYAAMHIELIPDRCTGCLKCEDVCVAGCIDITKRSVDNARCTRCFNCVAVCPHDAIRYQLNPTGIITPLLRRQNPSVHP